MRWVWVLAVVVVGCVSPGAVSCPSGFVCPEGLECATVASTHYCVDQTQLGCTDGEACLNDNGTCHEGVCLPNECGNALVDIGEVCDDGNTVDADSCSATCSSTEVCGNDIVDPLTGEQCDSGVPGMSGDGCASTCTVEALAWREVTPRGIDARAFVALAFDVDRDITVLFGGLTAEAIKNDTWQFEQGAWVPVVVGASPPQRALAGMAYDEARHEMVLFGGIGATALADTWTFDGTTWTQRQPATSPPPRAFVNMAYHSGRSELVMFGGVANGAALGDTWVWNGTTWTEHTSNTHPPASALGVMGYVSNPNDGYIIYYANHQTWKWDGGWTNITTGSPPNPQFFDAMGAVPDLQVVAHGVGETWTFSNGGWVWESPSTIPVLESGTRMAWGGTFGGGVLMFGGKDGTQGIDVTSRTYRYSPSNWYDVFETNPSPPPRQGHAMVYDSRRGMIVMFGGGNPQNQVYGDTWEWSGGAWRGFGGGMEQFHRGNHSMVYDSKRERIVAFGGTSDNGDWNSGGTYLGDTIEWSAEGGSWEQPTVNGPEPRRLPAMAFDSERGVTVLFGGMTDPLGNNNVVYKNDTWTWDGTQWTQLTPAMSPPARDGGAMGYDPVRKRMVLFGGAVSFIPPMSIGDTWEFDGTTWTKLTPAVSPPARLQASLVFDPGRARMVLVGGRGIGANLDDIWEWDGTTWTQLFPQGYPGPIVTAVYNAIEQRVITYGDKNYINPSDDTWALEYSTPLANRERCLVSTDEDGDGLTGCQDPDCWARCTPLCPPNTTCPGTAPRCGDGTCERIENRAICPTDCN